MELAGKAEHQAQTGGGVAHRVQLEAGSIVLDVKLELSVILSQVDANAVAGRIFDGVFPALVSNSLTISASGMAISFESTPLAGARMIFIPAGRICWMVSTTEPRNTSAEKLLASVVP
jgi:hypothetical protein